MYFIYANSNNSKSFVFIKKRLEIYIKLRVSFTLNKSVGFNIRFVVVVVYVCCHVGRFSRMFNCTTSVLVSVYEIGDLYKSNFRPRS